MPDITRDLFFATGLFAWAATALVAALFAIAGAIEIIGRRLRVSWPSRRNGLGTRGLRVVTGGRGKPSLFDYDRDGGAA